MKDEWKNMKEESLIWLDPKHEKLYVVKETTCYENIKYFSKQEKEKKSSLKARCTRSYTHTSFVIEESYMNEKFHKSTCHQS